MIFSNWRLRDDTSFRFQSVRTVTKINQSEALNEKSVALTVIFWQTPVCTVTDGCPSEIGLNKATMLTIASLLVQWYGKLAQISGPMVELRETVKDGRGLALSNETEEMDVKRHTPSWWPL